MIRAAVRGLLVALAGRSPRLLYGAVDRVARLTAPLTSRPAQVDRVRAVFAHLGRGEARRVTRELHASALKSRVLGIALAGARGEPAYPPVAVDAAFASVRGPVILATFHGDAVGALGELVRRVPGEVAALHRMEWSVPGNVAGRYVGDADADSVAAFFDALATLRRGGCVLLTVDGARNGGHAVSLVGRTAMFQRGAFALARLSGAPILPLFARWSAATVDVACAPTIAAGGDEPAMARAMAGALERHLLAHPAAVGAQLLRQLSRT